SLCHERFYQLFSDTTSLLLILLTSFRSNPPTTDTYPLSLHDALPICISRHHLGQMGAHFVLALHQPAKGIFQVIRLLETLHRQRDRKSTRLNSSHVSISYAVFCLKKKII